MRIQDWDYVKVWEIRSIDDYVARDCSLASAMIIMRKLEGIIILYGIKEIIERLF